MELLSALFFLDPNSEINTVLNKTELRLTRFFQLVCIFKGLYFEPFV